VLGHVLWAVDRPLDDGDLLAWLRRSSVVERTHNRRPTITEDHAIAVLRLLYCRPGNMESIPSVLPFDPVPPVPRSRNFVGSFSIRTRPRFLAVCNHDRAARDPDSATALRPRLALTFESIRLARTGAGLHAPRRAPPPIRLRRARRQLAVPSTLPGASNQYLLLP